MILEKFIEGEEYTVPVLGNGTQARPLMVIPRHIEKKTTLSCHIFEKVPQGKVELVESALDDKLDARLNGLAIKAYQALGCRDFARVDFRVDKKRKPYLIDINPLPSLAKDDSFALAAEALGWTYDEMILRILDCALKRMGIR